MNYLRFLLFPVAILYGIAVFFRNLLYDIGIIPAKGFKQPVIVIGNLSVGGTGKTPMTEYLIRLLKEKFSVAALSRGYGRHTRGFMIAENDSTAQTTGDEPMQFRKKFPDITVAVDENRMRGIKKLFARIPELKVILLDDAFQHRSVKPGFSILLTDHEKMFYDDFLLPAGTLREWRAGKKRADIIVVTKCPAQISPVEKKIILKKINPEPHQKVFFSHIGYGEIKRINGISEINGVENHTVVLLTGISNPKPLENFLRDKAQKIIPIYYTDHHEYTLVEIMRLVDTFNNIASSDKIIITTEKDAMRLYKPGLMEAIEKVPVYYIPVEITFNEKEKNEFDKLVTEYVVRVNRKSLK